MREKVRKIRKGQVTIFIIIALIIIAIIAIVFYPKIREFIIPTPPQNLIPKTCFDANAKQAIGEIMLRGGTMKPELYFIYNNYTLDYLCYTSDWYKTCMMQKPLIKTSIENSAAAIINEKNKKCVEDMEAILKQRGYDVVSSGNKTTKVSIILDKVIVEVDAGITATKGEETYSFSSASFKSESYSKYYDLIMIASSIQNFETRYGDSSIETFMSLYPNVKVEKYKQNDGTKVYILTERNTGEKFQFATRSLAWPPGYNI